MTFLLVWVGYCVEAPGLTSQRLFREHLLDEATDRDRVVESLLLAASHAFDDAGEASIRLARRSHDERHAARHRFRGRSVHARIMTRRRHAAVIGGREKIVKVVARYACSSFGTVLRFVTPWR